MGAFNMDNNVANISVCSLVFVSHSFDLPSLSVVKRMMVLVTASMLYAASVPCV